MKNILYFVCISTFVMFLLSSCEKEATKFDFEQENVTANNANGTLSNYNSELRLPAVGYSMYRPLMCELGTESFGGCTPSMFGSCLILFPTVGVDLFEASANGTGHVDEIGDLVLDVFVHENYAPPAQEGQSTFTVGEDMSLAPEVIDDLFVSAGMATPSDYTISEGEYSATYEASHITVELTMGNSPVKLNVWISNCENTSNVAGIYHNSALSHLMQPEFMENYSDDTNIFVDQAMTNLIEFMDENGIGSYDFAEVGFDFTDLSSEGILSQATTLSVYDKNVLSDFANEVLAVDQNLLTAEHDVLSIIESYECSVLTDGNVTQLEGILAVLTTTRSSVQYWKPFLDDDTISIPKWLEVVLADGLTTIIFTGGTGNPVIGGIAGAIASIEVGRAAS